MSRFMSVRFTGDQSMLEGGRALAAGISGAANSLAESIAKEQARQQQMKDELDAFKGMGEFMTQNGQISAEQLAEISAMPLPKAKGYMTSLVADATRKQEAMTAEKLESMRAGKRNEIIYDQGRAYRRGEDGGYTPAVSTPTEPRMVPVVDPETGAIRHMVPEGAIMGRSSQTSADRQPTEYQASTGEKFLLGPQGQMVQINKPSPAEPSVGIGTIIPTAAGDLVVKGIDRNGMPETQLVQPDAAAIQAEQAAAAQRGTLAGQAASARAKVAAGNKRPGPDFLPFGTPYAEQAAVAEAKLAQLPPPRRGAPAQPGLSSQDQQALAWARSNPNDPRAAAILKRLGM